MQISMYRQRHPPQPCAWPYVRQCQRLRHADRRVNILQKNLNIGISIGDINGIGLEVVLKTFKDNRMLDICTPIIFGSTKLINDYKKALSLDNMSFHSIKNMDQAKTKKINVFECWSENVSLALGKNNEDGGKYAFISLEKATAELVKNTIDALVTAPINKKNIQFIVF